VQYQIQMSAANDGANATKLRSVWTNSSYELGTWKRDDEQRQREGEDRVGEALEARRLGTTLAGHPGRRC